MGDLRSTEQKTLPVFLNPVALTETKPFTFRTPITTSLSQSPAFACEAREDPVQRNWYPHAQTQHNGFVLWSFLDVIIESLGGFDCSLTNVACGAPVASRLANSLLGELTTLHLEGLRFRPANARPQRTDHHSPREIGSENLRIRSFVYRGLDNLRLEQFPLAACVLWPEVGRHVLVTASIAQLRASTPTTRWNSSGSVHPYRARIICVWHHLALLSRIFPPICPEALPPQYKH